MPRPKPAIPTVGMRSAGSTARLHQSSRLRTPGRLCCHGRTSPKQGEAAFRAPRDDVRSVVQRNPAGNRYREASDSAALRGGRAGRARRRVAGQRRVGPDLRRPLRRQFLPERPSPRVRCNRLALRRRAPVRCSDRCRAPRTGRQARGLRRSRLSRRACREHAQRRQRHRVCGNCSRTRRAAGPDSHQHRDCPVRVSPRGTPGVRHPRRSGTPDSRDRRSGRRRAPGLGRHQGRARRRHAAHRRPFPARHADYRPAERVQRPGPDDRRLAAG